jgi:hypothetical protein
MSIPFIKIIKIFLYYFATYYVNREAVMGMLHVEHEHLFAGKNFQRSTDYVNCGLASVVVGPLKFT